MPVYEFNCSKCGERFEVMGSYAEREKEHERFSYSHLFGILGTGS